MFQVDAFASRLFEGNPAAVVPLDEWLDDRLMLAIAGENNLSETAFLLPRQDGFAIRWFTPTTEVDLCGHATLASAYVVMQHLTPDANEVAFHTMRSGVLGVHRDGDRYIMDFPARIAERKADCPALDQALGRAATQHWCFRDDWVVRYSSAEEVAALEPDMRALAAAARMVIATAAGEGDTHFVSRVFAPRAGVDEDPVTGSAHCLLIPYWSAQLGEDTMVARQISRRGGTLYCQHVGERVRIGGSAALYAVADIYLP